MEARHSPHTMNHELLKAVATGDADLLAQVLGVWSTATAEQGGESCLQGVTAEGSSALHIAASRGYLELVVMICTQDISLIKATNNQLDTALICAARDGHADVVRYLVERASIMPDEAGNPVLRAKNLDGATAMHEAKPMSRDSGLAAVVDGKGVSPLYLAVVSNRGDMVEILIRESSNGVRSPASYKGPDAQTALHAAVYVGKEISESLQRWEPTLAKEVDSYGRTALHYAASAGKIGVVKLLLDSSLAYIRDNDGLFPVHYAAIAGKVNAIRKLMEICPNCDELVDKKRRNILHCAVEHGRVMVVWHIHRNPKFARMMNTRDDEGNTPLHLAVKHGHVTIMSFLMTDIRVNLSIMNNMGLTPLDVAVNKNDYDYTISSLANAYMGMCLRLCEAYHSPCYQARNQTDVQHMEGKEDEASNYTNVSQSILYISVLIAAGSFAAAFTVPGGYIAEGEDAGKPVIAGMDGFPHFVFANSSAFFLSTTATCMLVHANLTTMRMRDRRKKLTLSAAMVCTAVVFMFITFSLVVRLTLDPANSWDEYIVILVTAAVTVAAITRLVFWPLICFAAPICSRSTKLLRESRRPWEDRLKLLARAIIADVVISFLIVSLPSFVVRQLEFDNWFRRVSQGDANFSYPT